MSNAEFTESETSSDDQFFGKKSRVNEEPIEDSSVEIIDDMPEEDRKPARQEAGGDYAESSKAYRQTASRKSC